MESILTLGRRLGFGAAMILTAASITGCEYVEVNGIGTRTMDELNPPQNDLASFSGCQPVELGRWQATGEVVNLTDSVASYEVVVAFYDGETRLDERSEWIRDLKPGERAAIDGAWWVDDPERVRDCEVILVNRFG